MERKRRSYEMCPQKKESTSERKRRSYEIYPQKKESTSERKRRSYEMCPQKKESTSERKRRSYEIYPQKKESTSERKRRSYEMYPRYIHASIDNIIEGKFNIDKPEYLIITEDSLHDGNSVSLLRDGLIKHQEKIKSIKFEKINMDFYKGLLESDFASDFNNVYVLSIYNEKDNINEIIDNYQSDLPVVGELNNEYISRVTIDRVNKAKFSESCFDPSIMDNKTFLKGIDFIAKQINDNASGDLEKLLLIDKMLRENVSYDKEYYFKIMPTLTDLKQTEHKCHKVQTILRDRTAVCNAFTQFVIILLNHPLINIQSKFICGDVGYDECGHAWNEVLYDGKWYSYDFTHSLWFDKEKGTKYSMVKRPSPDHTKCSGNFDNLNELPRKTIERTYKKLENIHIKFPNLSVIYSDESKEDIQTQYPKKQEPSEYKWYQRHPRPEKKSKKLVKKK